MIAVQKVGAGLSGCFRYVMGEGRDPETKLTNPAPANENESRVAWVSGQGFGGWTPENRDTAELARRVMEFDATHQSSRTRRCEKDCMHLVLSWRTGETPSREEMERAAKEALGSLGMEKARALFVVHNDTKHAHLHIVASRINPETGRAFEDFKSYPKLQKWALGWERERGEIQCKNREKKDQLTEAIKERNAAAVLDLMTQRQATFTAKELDRTLAKVLERGADVRAFKAEVLGSAGIIRLYDRKNGAALDRYTTETVRETEENALNAAERLAKRQNHGLEGRHGDRALKQFGTMRDEQRRAFDRATGGEGLALIDGKAGTGKSYTIAAIRTAYQGAGYRGLGLAPTNAVARDMQGDGFTEARTIHSALFALKNDKDRWNKKTVVMVDEAAMIGTRLLGDLIARADQSGAKLVIVGDDRQLSSIERGGLFAELVQRHGAATLEDVVRQSGSHKAAAEMLSRGEFAEGVALLDKLGCIVRNNHQDESRAALVEKWKSDTTEAPEKRRFVFAYTNDDVLGLNAELREIRKQRGELGEDREFMTKDGKLNFAVRDLLIFSTTDKRKGIDCGAVGTIEKIDGQSITVNMDGKKERLLTFSADEYESFCHAYAGTIYKGQGKTLDEVYLYHTKQWKDKASYVALTRHTDNVALFVSTEVTRDTADLARQMARHDDNSASVAYATAEEAQAIKREQYDAASREATERKAEQPEADPASQKAEAINTTPATAPEKEQPEATAAAQAERTTQEQKRQQEEAAVKQREESREADSRKAGEATTAPEQQKQPEPPRTIEAAPEQKQPERSEDSRKTAQTKAQQAQKQEAEQQGRADLRRAEALAKQEARQLRRQEKQFAEQKAAELRDTAKELTGRKAEPTNEPPPSPKPTQPAPTARPDRPEATAATATPARTKGGATRGEDIRQAPVATVTPEQQKQPDAAAARQKAEDAPAPVSAPTLAEPVQKPAAAKLAQPVTAPPAKQEQQPEKVAPARHDQAADRHDDQQKRYDHTAPAARQKAEDAPAPVSASILAAPVQKPAAAQLAQPTKAQSAKQGLNPLWAAEREKEQKAAATARQQQPTAAKTAAAQKPAAARVTPAASSPAAAPSTVHAAAGVAHVGDAVAKTVMRELDEILDVFLGSRLNHTQYATMVAMASVDA